MNICVTGALGHIGSKLIRNLSLGSSDRVYLIDNLLTQRYASLFDLPRGMKYSFHELDILSEKIEPIIKASDCLLHLAAVTDAESSFHKPELVDRINREGVERVAELCARYNCRIVFPSTTSVYGSQKGTVDENCGETELKPQSPYADSKLHAEKVLKRLSAEKKLKFVTVRLGTIFGHSIGMRFHTAVNKFIWQAVAGEEITVWKTALNQKRPYCGLNDCVAAMNRIIKEQMFDCETYNIVSTNLTVQNIVDVIKSYIPKIKIKFVDSPIMNQLSYNVSNKKSLEKGFIYRDEIKKGVRETIEKLKNSQSAVRKYGL